MVTIWVTVSFIVFHSRFCLIFILITNRKSVFVTASYIEIMKLLKKECGVSERLWDSSESKVGVHPSL